MVGNVRLYFVIAVVNVFCTTLTVLFVTNSLGGRCDDRPGFYDFLGQSFQSVYIRAKRQKSETKMDLYLYRFGMNLFLHLLSPGDNERSCCRLSSGSGPTRPNQ